MANATQRVLIAAPGGSAHPSARYRPGLLEQAGTWSVETTSVPSLPTLDQIDDLTRKGGSDAVLILERVLPGSRETRRLRSVYKKVLLDLDDAVYSVPPALSESKSVSALKSLGRLALRGYPRASARRRPLIDTLGSVDYCVVGNSLLGKFAAPHCQQVIEIPSTVQPLETLPNERDERSLVWIGIADNLQYLSLLRKPLERLHAECDFRLTIVSSRPWAESPFPVDFVPWSPAAATRVLTKSLIGLAPLVDHPWTRGKCAHRSIVYGGHGVVPIASPVGITDEVILDGKTGFLARSESEWAATIRKLLADPALTLGVGEQAWSHVTAKYSDRMAASRWAEIVE